MFMISKINQKLMLVWTAQMLLRAKWWEEAPDGGNLRKEQAA